MAWVRFNRAFKWRIPGVAQPVKLGYSAGVKALVKAACARDAVAAGAAERIKAPSRHSTTEAQHGADTDAG